MVADITRKYVEMNPNLHVIRHFSNGQQALDALDSLRVDLAIVDVYMPVMDGITFLQELRARNHTFDVIMVTAASDPSQVKQLFSLGILDYLVKSFEYERFAQAMDRFVYKQQTLAHAQPLTQNALDLLLQSERSTAQKPAVLSKGLQEKTLSLVLNFMKKHPGESMTSEQIAEAIGLSRVTIRRYMNHLLGEGVLVSNIDYGTGGRPSVIYRYVK